MRRVAVALVSLSLAACGGLPRGAGSPARERVSVRQGEERVLLTRFSEVRAVAASRRYVFAAGPQGVAAYDVVFNRWLPPRALSDQAGIGSITTMAADPVGDGVWIGGLGDVTFYQPSTDLVSRTILGGIPRRIIFDRRNPGAGAIVLMQDGEALLVTTSGGTRNANRDLPPPADRIVSPELEDVYQQFPSLRSAGGILVADAQARSWPILSGTVAPDERSVYLGTAGDGLYKVDPLFTRAERLPFGLLSDGAGAVALAADGVWAAPAGVLAGNLRERGGLTFMSADLQQWRWVDEDQRGSLGGARAFDLAVRGRVAWMATDQGLARLDTRAGSAPMVATVWTEMAGLPSDRVFAVAARDDGAWAGTERGLVWVSDTGKSVNARTARVGETIASGLPIRALLAMGDTLWIGTDGGLLLLPPGGTRPVRTTLQQTDARLGGQVLALAASDSVVAVSVGSDVVLVNRWRGALLPRLVSANFALVGPVVALAMDGQTLWAVGPRGVLALDRGNGLTRVLAAPGEIAGEPLDIALDASFAWVASRAGVTRVARQANGLPW